MSSIRYSDRFHNTFDNITRISKDIYIYSFLLTANRLLDSLLEFASTGIFGLYLTSFAV